MLKVILRYNLFITLLSGFIVTVLQLEEVFIDRNIFSILFTIGVIALLIIANVKPRNIRWIRIGYALACIVGILYLIHETLVHEVFLIVEFDRILVAAKQFGALFMVVFGIIGYVKSSEIIKREE